MALYFDLMHPILALSFYVYMVQRQQNEVHIPAAACASGLLAPAEHICQCTAIIFICCLVAVSLHLAAKRHKLIHKLIAGHCHASTMRLAIAAVHSAIVQLFTTFRGCVSFG